MPGESEYESESKAWGRPGVGTSWVPVSNREVPPKSVQDE